MRASGPCNGRGVLSVPGRGACSEGGHAVPGWTDGAGPICAACFMGLSPPLAGLHVVCIFAGSAVSCVSLQAWVPIPPRKPTSSCPCPTICALSPLRALNAATRAEYYSLKAQLQAETFPPSAPGEPHRLWSDLMPVGIVVRAPACHVGECPFVSSCKGC